MGLGSGIRKKPIPDPGSRGIKGTVPDPGSGSATLLSGTGTLPIFGRILFILNCFRVWTQF